MKMLLIENGKTVERYCTNEEQKSNFPLKLIFIYVLNESKKKTT